MDGLVADVLVVCAFVEGLFKFCGVATGALAFIIFGVLWLGVTFSVAGDSGGEFGIKVSELGREGPVVFGGNNSSLVVTGFARELLIWHGSDSAVSTSGDCRNLNGAVSLPCDIKTGTSRVAFCRLWTDDGGAEVSDTLNPGRLPDMDITTVEGVETGVHIAGIF